MKKLFTSLFAAFALFAFAIGAQATNVSSTIAWIQTSPITGISIIQTTTALTSPPTCNTNAQYAVNGSTAAGKEATASLALALALGRAIYIAGTGACSVSTGAEDIFYVQLGGS